jgi:hypothetical protein
MSPDIASPPADAFTAHDWQTVRRLIREVDRPETRASFARTLFQWDLAVIVFRKIEHLQMAAETPDDTDTQLHAACLLRLLAIGQSLAARAQGFHTEELSRFGVSHDQIAAYVEELERSFRELHHGFSESDITQARLKLFGIPA